jgi:uncharacterized protein with GYD domain
MTHFTYTADTWATLARNPSDRSAVIGALIERLGGRLHSLHYIAGTDGGVFIYEMPDDTAVSATVIAAISPGHVKSIATKRLLTVEETMAAMRQAGSLTYRAPTTG